MGSNDSLPIIGNTPFVSKHIWNLAPIYHPEQVRGEGGLTPQFFEYMNTIWPYDSPRMAEISSFITLETRKKTDKDHPISNTSPFHLEISDVSWAAENGII